jgi:L-aspartate oxidase
MTALPLRYAIPADESGERLDVADLTNALRALMVRNMGIVRKQNRLLEAKREVGFWCRYALGREFGGKPGWELQNMLTVARLMIDAALARDESRGTHFRSDFPIRDDARWGQRHVASPPALTG